MSTWAWLLPPALLTASWLGLHWLRRELTPQRLAHPGPSPADVEVQWVTVPTANGKQLAAQWMPGQGDPLRGVAILLHGWGGNGSQLRPVADAMLRHGWSVLLPDARSHGRSEGDTFSSLPRFAEDLDACLDWLSRHHPERTQADGHAQVILLGHSLGAAASLLCASRRDDVSAVVSVSAFAHPEQVMRRWLAQYRIPFWPIGWLVNRYIESVIGHRFDDIAPVHTIAQVKAPVLLVHGREDDVVPLACAEQLKAAASNATLLVVPGHHDRFDDEAGLNERVMNWLDVFC
ncbi:alpha/beta hydrolase [Malikia granosa]|uniref:Dipeptidyl aminopeptidase n=1 Tax=Malikia granosa TaxID=263067 RepID=A0A2S9K1I7_9BURK|nr:alpha/beta fold hydrolase [Malikia granosa]PRD64310.1 hypothetical protein C6P64_15090 [Malikia granosa]